MKLLSGYISTWKKSFTLRGRASRAEYSIFFSFNMLLLIFIIVLAIPANDSNMHITSNLDDSFLDNLDIPTINGLEIPINAELVNNFINTGASIILYCGLFIIITIIPSITLTIRRLHDSNKSGVFLLLFLVPFGGLIVLVLMFLPSTPNENKYGALPV
ncbi:MAG: DUF805 domain-containing protein [SAR324 cluster bacterium]|nr:DUF805 domain-containing protein [SAR324 cluster bacterium]